MGRMIFLHLVVLLNTLIVKGQTYTSVIQTASGPVQGKISTSYKNTAYAAFKGIPYAKPPIGNLRFKPPVEVDSWTNVYNATNEGNPCVQYNWGTKSGAGSEDCLYINVYTPHTEFNSFVSKPVMVWIYGGAFSSGSSTQWFYGPDFLIAQDVIMVSFNYRVSALGFLNLEHENALGNAGLKDQNLALRWVKKNIAHFGGNPDKITIFGQSAGSVSVDLQVLSDMSAGLFSQSISMSGATLDTYWGIQSGAQAVEKGFLLGSKLGTNTTDKNTLLAKLYSVSASDIVVAANAMVPFAFRPSIEKADIATNQEKFLTVCSVSKYKSGNYTKGPHMLGFTANETISLFGSVDDVLGMTKSALETLGNTKYNIPFLPDLEYTVSVGSSKLYPDQIQKIIQDTTDLFFILGIDTKQQLMSSNNGYPIYYYRFSFQSNFSYHQGLTRLDGTGHSDDVPYILYGFANLPFNQSDIAITQQRMVKLFTNFAKYGNPTPEGIIDEVLGITWPDSRLNGEHLEIGSTLTVGPRPTNDYVKNMVSSGFGASAEVNYCTSN